MTELGATATSAHDIRIFLLVMVCSQYQNLYTREAHRKRERKAEQQGSPCVSQACLTMIIAAFRCTAVRPSEA